MIECKYCGELFELKDYRRKLGRRCPACQKAYRKAQREKVSKEKRAEYRQKQKERYDARRRGKNELDGYDRTGWTCKDYCKKYPCFTGIDNMSSNLAEFCIDCRLRDDIEIKTIRKRRPFNTYGKL